MDFLILVLTLETVSGLAPTMDLFTVHPSTFVTVESSILAQEASLIECAGACVARGTTCDG